MKLNCTFSIQCTTFKLKNNDIPDRISKVICCMISAKAGQIPNTKHYLNIHVGI